jgi:hypothetical protein
MVDSIEETVAVDVEERLCYIAEAPIIVRGEQS